jgi:hypothetical protein
MKTIPIKLTALHNEEWLGLMLDFKLPAVFFGVAVLGIGEVKSEQ